MFGEHKKNTTGSSRQLFEGLREQNVRRGSMNVLNRQFDKHGIIMWYVSVRQMQLRDGYEKDGVYFKVACAYSKPMNKVIEIERVRCTRITYIYYFFFSVHMNAILRYIKYKL